MLKQHRNLVAAESDLLRVGECVVDVPRREVACDGQSRRITLKALQVLLVLVAHPGRVVSREALLEWVWADTLPTDDVLTQAVTQLRKAFADDREAPQYIETIAKGGYRLLAPVQWLAVPEPAPVPAAPAPAPSGPATVARRPSRTARGGALLALALLAAALGWWWLHGARTPLPVPTPMPAPVAQRAAAPAYQRITSLPGGEVWPSLSPDGAQVVYSAWTPDGDQAALMVQTTAPVPARAITAPPKGVQDTMPAWSPNGREIAFQRLGPGERCGLYVVPASGGEPRSVSACKRSDLGWFSWHPDGRHLIGSQLGAVAGDDGALHLLDLATGAWRPLPYRKRASDLDLSPMYSPDGRWIAFRRNLSLSDLWRVPAAGGAPERLTHLRTNVYGLAWAPDGRSLLFSRYRDATPVLARLDLASGRVADFGVVAAYPAIALRAPSLAFMVGHVQAGLYRLDLDRADAEPEPVFPSTGLDLMPSVSPDGRQLAWMSSRSGALALWWARPDQPDSLRLIDGVTPMPRYPAVWAADGRRLLVVGREGERLALYEVQPGSGRVQRLPVPAGEPVQGAYLPGTQRLLVVADRGAGRLGLTLYDRAASPWAALAQLDDVAFVQVDAARGRLLFTRPSAPGLWQAGLDLGGVRQLASQPPVGAGRRLALLPDGLWLAGSERQCVLQWAPLATDPARRPCRLPGEGNLGSVSLDLPHQRLYYAVERDESPDIGWMPLPAR